MRSVDVCLSPDLLHLYDVEGKVVVVVDILRATSVMTTAMAHGMEEIVPVSTVEECLEYKEQGYICAGERNGKTVEGFDFGNSPFSYMDESMSGAKLAMTTTNGTYAINKASMGAEVVVGSFLNISAVVEYLLSQEKDVMVLCAGWKGRINLEDSLFAGAVIEGLRGDFSCEHDGSLVAHSIYVNAKDDMSKFLSGCSHFRRLSNLNIDKDIKFCLQTDEYSIVPILQGRKLVKLEMSRVSR